MMIPFQITDWANRASVTQSGTKGSAVTKTVEFRKFKMRMVEYSANYEADHWCNKGHIAYCISGVLIIELNDTTKHVLRQGSSFEVSDEAGSHKAYSEKGAKLFIIDGEFLEKGH